MRTDLFDFDLPEELIAQHPLQDRSSCKLVVLDRDGTIRHLFFTDLVGLLSEDDLLVLNDTRVFPARLRGTRKSGAPLDVLLVRQVARAEWEIMSKGGYTGPVIFSETLSGDVNNGTMIRFHDPSCLHDEIWSIGKMPLPPYIKRDADEKDRVMYQTVYAKKEGSIAAPTAGLHFTGDILERIRAKGVKIELLTLHVGPGTFKPLKTESVEGHIMDSEFFEISQSLMENVRETRERGKRVIAVGTTTTRALEGVLSGYASVTCANGTISGQTDIFIYPGYRFLAVDSLLTNMHLPRSTPLLLASALAGRERLLAAYRECVKRKYRFFSYGDAMLIL